MNKKLLLIALLCSAPIMAKAPDLAGTDTDGCPDPEKTLYDFWRELRNASKRSNEPVTTRKQQVPLTTEPEEIKPHQTETPPNAYKNTRNNALLEEELEARKTELSAIKLLLGFAPYKSISLSHRKSDAQSALQSPKTRALVTLGAGTLGAIIAGTIVDNRFGVNSGPHAFALLEVATITAAIKMYRNAQANNKNCAERIKFLEEAQKELELEFSRFIQQVAALEVEIERLEQELKQQQA